MTLPNTKKEGGASPSQRVRRRELGFGIAAALAAALFALLVIPSGVETPDSVDHLPLSPAFLPYAATGLIFVFALLHILESAKAPTSADLDPKNDPSRRHPSWMPRGIAIALCLIGYYYLPQHIGLLAVSIIVTSGLMYLGGERSKIVLVSSSVLFPILVFLFFTRVAQVPLPLGFFE